MATATATGATKWLSSVSVVCCAFMAKQLAHWHIVYIFLEKINFKKWVKSQVSRVELAIKKRAGCRLARFLFIPKILDSGHISKFRPVLPCLVERE